MKKIFNINGACDKDKHYMVDISEKIKQIRSMVDEGKYFSVNRGRLYGKTTLLSLLEENLKSDYMVISISFEGDGHEKYTKSAAFKELNAYCKEQKVVLIVDEVDYNCHNLSFLDFLGRLRAGYMKRHDFPTFHSVILTGVRDITNLGHEIDGGINYSPWNIAADFEADMSFNPAEIESMLKDYESEHSTGMNMTKIAEEIYDYTSGYPFLVSQLCKIIDEKLDKDWTVDGIYEAVKIISEENNTLSEDLIKNIENNPDLAALAYSLIILGDVCSFNAYIAPVRLGVMYSILKRRNGFVAISNKIFEILITRYFVEREIGRSIERKKNNHGSLFFRGPPSRAS